MALYYLKNPAVKRLMKEAEELREPTEEYHAEPLDGNLFEWHFTIRGSPTTDFDSGIYHGKITLPPQYPMNPPNIYLLTPNGRFEVNKKICLSISDHHPETWRPSWSIRTALLALIGFFPTHGNGAIAALEYSPEERKHLALKSRDWKCPECGYVRDFLKKDTNSPEDKVEVSDVKLKGDHKVTQLSDGAGFLRGEGLAMENQSFSKIDHTRSNSFKSHAFLSQCVSVTKNNTPTVALPRNRYFTSAQDMDHSQSVKIETVQSEESKQAAKKETYSFCNLFSLLVMWVIAVILGILILRRLL